MAALPTPPSSRSSSRASIFKLTSFINPSSFSSINISRPPTPASPKSIRRRKQSPPPALPLHNRPTTPEPRSFFSPESDLDPASDSEPESPLISPRTSLAPLTARPNIMSPTPRTPNLTLLVPARTGSLATPTFGPTPTTPARKERDRLRAETQKAHLRRASTGRLGDLHKRLKKAERLVRLEELREEQEELERRMQQLKMEQEELVNGEEEIHSAISWWSDDEDEDEDADDEGVVESSAEKKPKNVGERREAREEFRRVVTGDPSVDIWYDAVSRNGSPVQVVAGVQIAMI